MSTNLTPHAESHGQPPEAAAPSMQTPSEQTDQSSSSVESATAHSPTDAGHEAEIASTLGLTDGDRRFLWAAGGVILVLSALHWGRLSGWGLHEVEIERLPERQFDFRVDINHATWVEWMQLEGIGELTARKIIADREQRGAFGSIDDVDRVPGIGPKTLAAIRPWLICSDCEAMRSSSEDNIEAAPR